MTTADLNQMALKALEGAVNPERVQELLDAQVQKTVDDAICEALRSYGPFGKKLKEKLEAALDLNDLNLPGYGVMVTGLVERFMKDNMSAIISERLEEDLKGLLNIAPRRVKLSEIVEEMKRHHEEDGAYGDVVTCVLTDDASSYLSGVEGYYAVYLDDEEHRRDPTDASFKICLSRGHLNEEQRELDKKGALGAFGTIYHIQKGRSAWVSSKDKVFTVGQSYGLEARLLAYYAAGTIIELDEDCVNTAVGDY